jgi:hypothetical protein
LHTRLGRLELWYEEHKDGFMGLVTTVTVSFITALLTFCVVERLRSPVVDLPRAGYESELKLAP